MPIPSLLVAAAGAVAVAIGAPPSEWPQFLGPTRDGVYAAGDIAGPWQGERSPVVWSRAVGEGLGGPVVAAGRVVLHHRLGDAETVECLDASSGERRWTFESPSAYRNTIGTDDSGPRATPAVVSGRVVTVGAEGKVHALALEDGTRLWSLDVRERLGADLGYFGLAGSPLVEGDRVLLNVGGRPGAGIIALEAATGKVLWTATDDGASCSSPVAATIDGKRRALFFTRAGLRDLDPATGAARAFFPWRARIQASVNAATPLVLGDRVFISASYGTGAALLAVTEAGFEKVWTGDESLSCHYATSVHRGGFLYGFDGRQEYRPHLRCVELATGKVRWSADRFGAGTVTLAGEHLVILREDGELVLARARPEKLELLARAPVLEGQVLAHPALAGGRLYARSGTRLVCVALGGAK
ncbi:MAG: PQQ-like beta-propeller repeat protein [Planctomycetes bacterium]|nr:PQQ-like beta-propeller repeat protein [Planctomycetota bacterium]